MKAPLTDSQKASRSINFGSHQGERPHSLGRELRDLRSDIEEAFVALEGNDNIPVITGIQHTRTNFETVNADGGNKLIIDALTIHGTNLLANRSIASANVFATGSTANYLVISSIIPGLSGNDLAVEVVPAGADNGLSAEVVNGVLTISLACTGGNINNDASNALSAIKAIVNAEFDNDFNPATVVGDETDIISAAISQVSLSGGTGEGLSVVCSQPGQAAVNLELASVSDSAITVKASQVLNAQAAVGDQVGISVSSHTAQSNTCLLIVLA